jgi:hypothetical protein
MHEVEARGGIVSVDVTPVLDLLNGETLPLGSETTGKASDRVLDITGVAHVDSKGQEP